MSKMNLLLFLNTYGDINSTNAPNLNNFRWTRDIAGLFVDRPSSTEFSLAPGENRTLFDSNRTLSHNGTTIYDLEPKPLSSGTYVLSHSGGTAPNFRTPRTTGADATTQITVTQNGPLLTFTSTGGTALNLIVGGAVVGDYARLGSLFSSVNQGEYKILSLTATSFTVKNESGTAEGPITLGAGFAEQIQIYSALGVQVGDTLKINGGFSPVTRKTFKITSVSANSLEFFSVDALPTELGVQTDQFSIYFEAKQFIYVEADKKVSLIINGVSGNEIEPFVIGSSILPGIFLRKSTIYSLSITNSDTDSAKIFVASVQ